MTSGSDIITFAAGDLERFASASGDVNPLHTSDDYARRTAYGQRVAHGVLGLLHALGAARTWRGELVELSATFASPMFVGVPYVPKVEVDALHDVRVRLLDGRRMAVKATAKLRHSTPMRALSAHAIPKRSSPRTWQPSELREGLAVGGVYASPDPPLDEFLLHVTGLCDRGLPRWQVAILLACSFVVGMELPGRQALFAALNVVFESGIEDDTPSFEYEACIDSYETRFDRAVVGVRFTRGTQTLARATMKAFARIEIPSAYSATTGPARAPADSARRVALVTGASRGLGASLSTALAERGWTVVGTYRESRVDAEALAAWAATTSGRFVPLRGDAADAIFWRDSIPRLIAEHSGIDLLVCNAFPPLQPLWIEPAAATRIVDYVGRSVAMTAIPLSHAIDAVATRRGTLLMISSACVHGDSVDWPHYVAAKGAIEGLARVVAAEFPAVRVIVARPPRLRTDFSNAPLARGEAMAPSRMAAILVERVGAARPEGGGVEIMETFEEGQTGGLS